MENSKKKNAERLEHDPQNQGRRKAVKTIVGGVSAIAAYNLMPANWSKPLVEQVFLPAHAGTSGATLNDPCSVRVIRGNQSSQVVVVRVKGFITPATGNLPVRIVGTANLMGGGSSSKKVKTTTHSNGSFEANISLNGPGVMSVSVRTTVEGASGSAECSVNVPSSEPETTGPPTTVPQPTTTFND
ncbi:MAG: hypothetical protein CSA26_01145 [Desulfobacterales bacterium]|nr:MAG: hypothetical protein CSA26_01145 [Desulfobacterales bacterium]